MEVWHCGYCNNLVHVTKWKDLKDGNKKTTMQMIGSNRRGGWSDECFDLHGPEQYSKSMCSRMHLQYLSEGLDGYLNSLTSRAPLERC